MYEALVAGIFLVIATVIGLFLSPLEAQIQAANAKPATDTHHDDGHGHHGH